MRIHNFFACTWIFLTCSRAFQDECWNAEDSGASYRGFVAVTKSGRTCQEWSSQSPHQHDHNTPESNPSSGLERNYCRNPDDEDSPYCYTMDSNMRWEYCTIPKCPGCTYTNLHYKPPAGDLSVTLTGKKCQSWSSFYPHWHTRTANNYPEADLTSNYCRNPDNEAGIWCYTTDPDVRWEYCEIPLCTITCWETENRGASYRGFVSTTETGKVCKRWNETKLPAKYPGYDLHENYCRNPKHLKKERPWCYTASKKTEYCSIPECTKGRVDCWNEKDNGASYKGSISTTKTGKTCVHWSLKGHTSAELQGNYCRNPDEKASPWCYTEVEGDNWEYCFIPSCTSGCTFNPEPISSPPDQLTRTLSGKTCQSWNSQSPHKHFRTRDWFPEADLSGNYCRNPDGKPGHWCYTSDPNVRWEMCVVPTCTTTCSDPQSKGASYRGTASTTISGKTCQEWNKQHPHKHSRTSKNYPASDLTSNYCRNPDGKDSTWCHTTDPNTAWEYCQIKECISDECWGPDDSGKGYRGFVPVTKSNKTCQSWSSQSPHAHTTTPERHISSGLIKNYCRNPDGKDSPWCYTTDAGTLWEYCYIPKCTDCWNSGSKGASYRGKISITVSGKPCQRWDEQKPHSHHKIPGNYPGSDLVGNYCRNPSGEMEKPWCFTTSAGKTWEYCAVPMC